MKPVNPLESWCSYQGGKDKNSASSNNYNNDCHFLLLVSPNQTLSTLHTLSGKPSQQSWNKRDDCLHLIQQMRKLRLREGKSFAEVTQLVSSHLLTFPSSLSGHTVPGADLDDLEQALMTYMGRASADFFLRHDRVLGQRGGIPAAPGGHLNQVSPADACRKNLASG